MEEVRAKTKCYKHPDEVVRTIHRLLRLDERDKYLFGNKLYVYRLKIKLCKDFLETLRKIKVLEAILEEDEFKKEAVIYMRKLSERRRLLMNHL
jgi:hypothetical protein